MKRLSVAAVFVLGLAACEDLVPADAVVETAPQPEDIETTIAAPPADATSVEDFDTTTTEDRQAALDVEPEGEVEIGRTVASLGDPVDPGFWLATPLVTQTTDGRVFYAPSGNSVAVELRPLDGPDTAGSRISLPAMRLLGAPLTSLAELVVFSG